MSMWNSRLSTLASRDKVASMAAKSPTKSPASRPDRPKVADVLREPRRRGGVLQFGGNFWMRGERTSSRRRSVDWTACAESPQAKLN